MMITLVGTPPSTQHIYRYTARGGFVAGYMTREGKDKKEEYQWEMRSQYKGKVSDQELRLDVKYYFGDKRKHDIDNFSKLWMDAGTGIIWLDDGQITELKLSKFLDKENPRIEITIL